MNKLYAVVKWWRTKGGMPSIEEVAIDTDRVALESEGQEWLNDWNGGDGYAVLDVTLTGRLANAVNGLNVPGVDAETVAVLKGENGG